MPLDTNTRRQFQRRDCDVPVVLAVAEASRGQIALIAGPAIGARMTNVSGGGAYVVSATFLPRAAQLVLDVPAGATLPGGRARCRVMSLQMLDIEPHYGIGLRFEDEESTFVRAIRALDDRGTTR